MNHKLRGIISKMKNLEGETEISIFLEREKE